MFSVNTTPEEFKNAAMTVAILDLCLRKLGQGNSYNYRNAIVFEKFYFQVIFHSHEKSKLSVFVTDSINKSISQSLNLLGQYA